LITKTSHLWLINAIVPHVPYAQIYTYQTEGSVVSTLSPSPTKMKFPTPIS